MQNRDIVGLLSTATGRSACCRAVVDLMLDEEVIGVWLLVVIVSLVLLWMLHDEVAVVLELVSGML